MVYIEDVRKEVERLVEISFPATQALPLEVEKQVKNILLLIQEYAVDESQEAWTNGFEEGQYDRKWEIDEARDDGYSAGFEDGQASVNND